MIIDAIMQGLALIAPQFIGDKDRRDQFLGQARMAVIAGASVWGPLGWCALISTVGLVAYCLSVVWLHQPFVREVALILMIIPFAAFGIDISVWIKARKELNKD